jgi:UDP-N-acetylmuramoyl-tripeptide--D-alanyl-D-alanine ligase
VVLNDSYNASPSSMRAALESLGALAVAGRRIAVLGEMRELGPHAAAEHVDVAHVLADARVLVLVAVGPGTEELAATATARGVEVHRAADHEAAIRLVREIAAPGDAVLVKASRAVGLERVAHALVDAGAEPR